MRSMTGRLASNFPVTSAVFAFGYAQGYAVALGGDDFAVGGEVVAFDFEIDDYGFVR